MKENVGVSSVSIAPYETGPARAEKPEVIRKNRLINIKKIIDNKNVIGKVKVAEPTK